MCLYPEVDKGTANEFVGDLFSGFFLVFRLPTAFI